jgi:WD40 repeat protein
MPQFKSIVKNERYSIGCTGQTVWVWDKNDTVIAKFKDLKYAYRAMISPRGDSFIVRSNEGLLAVYSLKNFSLIKKFRFSKEEESGDYGCCFSQDGKYFLNIEYYKSCWNATLAIYDTADFSLVSRIIMGERMHLSEMQIVDGECFVLGYTRGEDRVRDCYFIAKFKDNKLRDAVKISESDYWFHIENIPQTVFGYKLTHRGFPKYTPGKLWSCYFEKDENSKLFEIYP